MLAKNTFNPPYSLLSVFYRSQQPGAEVSVGAFVLVAVGWLSPDPWLCWAAVQRGWWGWCRRALRLRPAPCKSPAPRARGSSTSQLEGVAAQRAPGQSLMPPCARPCPVLLPLKPALPSRGGQQEKWMSLDQWGKKRRDGHSPWLLGVDTKPSS